MLTVLCGNMERGAALLSRRVDLTGRLSTSGGAPCRMGNLKTRSSSSDHHEDQVVPEDDTADLLRLGKLHSTTDAMVWAQEWCIVARKLEYSGASRSSMRAG